MPCPATHNFPFDGGDKCCKYYRRKLDPATNPLWDGSNLASDDPEDFCFDDDFLECEQYSLGGICLVNNTSKSRLTTFLPIGT